MNNKWWDGYSNEKTVIIDDYRASLCTYQDLLRILDRYPLRVEMKGTTAHLAATVFIITTNARPEVMWASRTEEALDQLLRRITTVIEFKANNETVVLKNIINDLSADLPIIDYVPHFVPAFNPL
jgi:hypothetical protein